MAPKPPRARAVLGRLWIPLIVLAASAATAVACLSPKPTSISTSLTGGGKEGAEITVSEGTGVKDTATLSGENAGKATGTVDYAVYSDSKCEKLVTKAGSVTVKEGKVPASEEEKLEAGAVYYWQAEYLGDSIDEASKSPCGKEVLTVKAKTSLSTSLSGGGKEGEEITVSEGSKVKDTATLSGTKASTATGTVDYAAYKDKECKELASKAGEGKVEGTKAGGSEEKELEAAAVYYWQAEYLGDSLHEKSTSPCGKEVLTVKAKTSLSTSLSGGGKEGEEITVREGVAIADTATLSGTKFLTATGTVKYAIYKDKECKELVTGAGEVTVKEGKIPNSEEKELEARATFYYWQATYSGDGLHLASTSLCTELGCVLAPADAPKPASAYAGDLIPNADADGFTKAISAATHRSSHPTTAAETTASHPTAEKVVLPGLSTSSSSGPSTAAMSAFTRQGISSAHARRALRSQDRIAKTQVVKKIESALAGAYAGAWFEPAGAKLHIGVTSAASRKATASVIADTHLAADVVQTPVSSTLAKLEAVQEQWNAKLAKLLRSGKAMTGIDLQHNAVVVKLDASVSAQQRTALERAALNATVNVVITAASSLELRNIPQVANCEFVGSFLVRRVERAAWCEKTITSGVKIVGPPVVVGPVTRSSVCTAGPMLISGIKTFVLTAGHCVTAGKSELGEMWKSEWPVAVGPPTTIAGRTLGKVTKFQYNNAFDSAEIEVERPGEFSQALPTPVPAKLAEWGNWQAYKGNPPTNAPPATEGKAIQPTMQESRTVDGALPAVGGIANCHEGKSTGEQCGVIGMIDVNPGNGIITEHLVEDTACSEHGDSGGPYFYHGNGSEVYLEGTLAGGNGDGRCNNEGRPPGGGVHSYYEPIETLLAGPYWGQKLLRRGNEVRRPRVRGAKGAPLTKLNFASSSGASTIETVGGSELTCSTEAGTGEASSESSGTAELTLTGCEAFEKECHTMGEFDGEVVLSGSYKLVFINGEEDEVGLLLELIDATIECGKNCEKAIETLELRGTAIGTVAPIDEEVVPSEKVTVTFFQSGGIQVPTEYEEEDGTKAKAVLELEGSGEKAFGFEEAGMSDLDELLFEEEAEIEA
jgi:hypothetical protein